MRLGDLAPGAGSAEVTGFAIDHRNVLPGNVFGAFPGARANGEDYIAAAVAAGAVAVVARPGARVDGAAHIADEEPRAAFARAAARFFAPLPETLVAVTGTNGKTSTVELTRQLWTMAGRRAASIGTLGVTVGDDRRATGLTTPDVVTFLSNLHGLAREGVQACAFEASSHGLEQRRVAGLNVQSAAFTNFTRDHLDYHGTMEAYLDAKLILFREVLDDIGTAVVWADDPAAAKVTEAVRHRDGIDVCSVGVSGLDWRLLKRTPTSFGQELLVRVFNGGEHRVRLPLIGAYQAANALIAAALVVSVGGRLERTLSAMERLVSIRGRLERALVTPRGAGVYVDYAHTEDALVAAIAALRPHTPKRLILVFGAGGDRDPGKRGPMGRASVAADVAIVTDDNPRHENAAAIRAAVLLGAAPVTIEIGDRRDAIAHALAEAGEGDTVLIAGKGHETGQIVGGVVHPFDDVAVAREVAA